MQIDYNSSMYSVKTGFKAYLQKSSKEIEKALNKFSKEWSRYISKDFSDLENLNSKFIDSFYGGKMLRGTLVKLGYELFKREKNSAIIKPAIAFEIFHTSLLIHDDIIDQSSLRRGKPAMHLHKNKQYGISQAMCLGDLGITLSIKLLSESNFSNETKNNALNYFLEIITDTILGEMLDIKSS